MTTKTQWQYLKRRPQSRWQQLYIKDRKLKAHTVWSDMVVNQWSEEETAYNWDLPIEAVREAIEYCEANLELLKKEATEEQRYLKEQGVLLEPEIVNR